MPQDPIIIALQNRRIMAGLSRQQVADLAGMSKRTYDRIERGEADIKISQYRAIVRELGLSDLDIFLDVLEIEQPTAEDVAAVSRLLSVDARGLLIKLIMTINSDRN